MNDTSRLETARRLDEADPLAHFRERFCIPPHGDGETIYFCGNSLGLQPRSAARYVSEELEAWARLAVRGHFEGSRPWIPYPERVTENMARLVGARPIEVMCMNTLTVNLHLMMVSFYRPSQARHRILIERGAFPSDRYAVVSQIRFHGYDPETALIEVGPREGETCLRTDDLEALIEREGKSIALVLLPGVQYYSGEVYELQRIARAARRQGCRVGFDLAHSVGNVPLALHDTEADFAAWCTYKYLNAGPGAIAGCFVHERHAHEPDLPRFAGWWGHDPNVRFEMGPDFIPMAGAAGWQLSNPPILALAPLIASLEIFHEAGPEALRAKSLQLSGYLETLIRERLSGAIEIITPLAPARRGCQLSLRVCGDADRGRALHQQLESAGVICDWREPDVIRAAPVPLYNRFEEVYRFVAILEKCLLDPA